MLERDGWCLQPILALPRRVRVVAEAKWGKAGVTQYGSDVQTEAAAAAAVVHIPCRMSCNGCDDILPPSYFTAFFALFDALVSQCATAVVLPQPLFRNL